MIKNIIYELFIITNVEMSFEINTTILELCKEEGEK